MLRIFAATIVVPLLAAPAMAGEATIPQVGGTLASREDIKLLANGLAEMSRVAASLPQGTSSALVSQQGMNNQATVIQAGGGLAVVRQSGQGNSAVVVQRR